MRRTGDTGSSARPYDGGSTRIPSLDGLRGVAFLLVFASHARIPHADGALGVTIFFFLSGFLVTTLLLREEERTGGIAVGAFYRRRAWRILPLFYLVLGLTALLTVVGAREAQLEAGPLAAQALHLSNYLFIVQGEAGTPIGTDTYWSLAVEEHFYLVFPLLALLAVRGRVSRRTRLAGLLALCLAVLLWRTGYVLAETDYVAERRRTYLASDMRADGILVGCALAVALESSRLQRLLLPLRRGLLPLGLVALWAATTMLPPAWEPAVQTSAQAAALVPVFAGLVLLPPRLLQVRPLVWLGSVSYAAYLLHRAVLEALERAVPAGSLVMIVAGLAVTLAGAEVCRRAVELPLARRRSVLHVEAASPAREHT